MSGWMCRAPKLMTGSGAATSTHGPGGGRPAGRLGEHPQERRLVQPEPAVAGADPQDDLLGPDDVAVVERLEPGLGRVGAGQHVAEQVARLVDAAQDGVLAGEDLHRHERIEALLRRGCSRHARNRRQPSRPTGSRATAASASDPSVRLRSSRTIVSDLDRSGRVRRGGECSVRVRAGEAVRAGRRERRGGHPAPPAAQPDREDDQAEQERERQDPDARQPGPPGLGGARPGRLRPRRRPRPSRRRRPRRRASVPGRDRLRGSGPTARSPRWCRRRSVALRRPRCSRGSRPARRSPRPRRRRSRPGSRTPSAACPGRSARPRPRRS